MKKLVVYYSFEGNSRFIAQVVAEETGADLLELKPRKEIKTHSFLKYILCGIQVMIKKKPELIAFDKNPGEYDVLFIGTPVWIGGYAPALNTFFSDVDLEDKYIALFCCCGIMKGNVFKKMKDKLSGNNIVSEKGFTKLLKSDNESNADEAGNWAREVMSDL